METITASQLMIQDAVADVRHQCFWLNHKANDQEIQNVLDKLKARIEFLSKDEAIVSYRYFDKRNALFMIRANSDKTYSLLRFYLNKQKVWYGHTEVSGNEVDLFDYILCNWE